jgi:hypothetical protein
MSTGVGRPDLKLQQAGVHLKTLKQAIDTYRYDGSFHVEQARREDGSAIDFTLRISSLPPIDEWSLIVGDCVHNMRAALDQLAWQLDSAPTTGPGGTTFPIYIKEPKSWPTPSVARMPAAAQPIIEGLQPYNEPTPDRIERHPLATLHALDISDKHHVLIAAVGKVAGDSVAGLPFGSSMESAVFPPFADGAKIATVTYPAGEPTPTLQGNIAFDVVLVDVPWVNANILWVLEELLLGWITRFVADPLIALIP